jgi:hypothetical protein
MPGSWPPGDFPLLADYEWVAPPSPATMRYNCIAWSVGRTNRKWWPDPWGVGEWFRGVARLGTLEAFIFGYRSIGYIECTNGTLEPGIEKIALYATAGAFGELVPTHAAYQLENGRWTSKLGDFEDIEHYRVDSLTGRKYGAVVQYMSRQRQPRPAPPNN